MRAIISGCLVTGFMLGLGLMLVGCYQIATGAAGALALQGIIIAGLSGLALDRICGQGG